VGVKTKFFSADTAIREGLNFAQKGQLKNALAAFTTAIELDRFRWEAYRYRAIAYVKLKRYNLALRNYNITIQHSPLNADYFYERGIIYLFSSRFEAALKDFSNCLIMNPDYASAYSSRARILYRKGLYQKALKDIQTAIEIQSKNSDYLHNRAVILTALGHFSEAIKDYKTVIKLNPKSGGSYNNLAWILSTVKDPAYRDCHKAIRLARKSLQFGQNVSWMDTLAAAYAECGEFEKAIHTEEKAYKLSVPHNKNFRKRIQIYKSGKTYAEWILERNSIVPEIVK
jgi:tetratricopeptide (TPR) repeat protein